MTDYWTTQWGRIHDVLTIDCVSYGSIDEGSAVLIYGTTTADQITVQCGQAKGDSTGIALKAASATGETIPVLFHGVFKCYRDDGTIAIGQQDFVYNSITCNAGATSVAAGTATTTSLHLFTQSGGSWVLGMALQDFGTDGDYALVLVGKCI
jgi:hypothetical protein